MVFLNFSGWSLDPLDPVGSAGYKSCTSAITSVRLVDSGDPELAFHWKDAVEMVTGRKEVIGRIKTLNEERLLDDGRELREKKQVGYVILD